MYNVSKKFVHMSKISLENIKAIQSISYNLNIGVLVQKYHIARTFYSITKSKITTVELYTI